MSLPSLSYTYPLLQLHFFNDTTRMTSDSSSSFAFCGRGTAWCPYHTFLSSVFWCLPGPVLHLWLIHLLQYFLYPLLSFVIAQVPNSILIVSAKFNKGKNKIYAGVPGNLVAFACKMAFDKRL